MIRMVRFCFEIIYSLGRNSPSFTLFINFLGPLLGIALGFDAVNSEQNKGH